MDPPGVAMLGVYGVVGIVGVVIVVGGGGDGLTGEYVLKLETRIRFLFTWCIHKWSWTWGYDRLPGWCCGWWIATATGTCNKTE